VSTAVFGQSEIAAEDEHFDAVISRHGLMFVEDAVGAVQEAARVLRPGGRYAAMTWGPRDLNQWLGLVLDAVGEQFGVPFPPPNVRGPFSLDDAVLLTSVLRDGGLLDVQVETIATPMRGLAGGLVGARTEASRAARDRIGRYGAGRPRGDRAARAQRRCERLAS
jgi:SAM-dependent methyltransferase